MSGSVGLGILGTGSIARVHADAAKRTGYELAAVAGRREKNAEMFAQWKGARRWYASFEELLADPDVDVVSICLPNFLHARWSVEAAKAGKHVLCEKPICMNFRELDEIRNAVGSAGVRFFYAEELCYMPSFVRVKDLVEQGAIGDVVYVRQREMHAGPYSPWFFDPNQAGGGALVDMGCHGIGLINWLVGAAPRRVFGRVDRLVHRDIEVEDYALVLIEYENGALGVSESGWCLKDSGMESTLEVLGTKGSIRVSPTPRRSIFVVSEEGYGMLPDLTKGCGWEYADELWELGYEGEFAHFRDLLSSDEPVRTGLDEAALVLQIMMAAYRSASDGRWVDLPFAPDVRYPFELVGW